MSRSSAIGLFAVCLLVMGVSGFVLLNKVGSPAPAIQAESAPIQNQLNQARLSLSNLKKLKLAAPPGAAQPTAAQQSQESQQIAQLQDQIADLQAQLTKSQNSQSNDMLTEVIAAVGALGGLIGSVATLITALKGPLKT